MLGLAPVAAEAVAMVPDKVATPAVEHLQIGGCYCRYDDDGGDLGRGSYPISQRDYRIPYYKVTK